MMSANFSSLVGEFMNAGIPKYCKTIVKNKHFNGHPDMIPAGMFPGDDVQHASEGIQIKASRYGKGWQGHNPEDTWLMVFIYDSNRTTDYGRIRSRFSLWKWWVRDWLRLIGFSQADPKQAAERLLPA